MPLQWLERLGQLVHARHRSVLNEHRNDRYATTHGGFKFKPDAITGIEESKLALSIGYAGPLRPDDGQQYVAASDGLVDTLHPVAAGEDAVDIHEQAVAAISAAQRLVDNPRLRAGVGPPVADEQRQVRHVRRVPQ